MKTLNTVFNLSILLLTAFSFSANATKYDPPKGNPTYTTEYNTQVKPEFNNYVKPNINTYVKPEINVKPEITNINKPEFNIKNNIKPEITNTNINKPEFNNTFNSDIGIKLTNKSYSQVDVANLLKNQQEQLQKQFQRQGQQQNQTNGNNDVVVGFSNIGNQYVPEQAPPVNAPGLVASTGFNWNTCLGSVSQGVSAAVFGESAATTVQIQVCIAAQMAQLTNQLRMNPLLAKELLCSDPGFNFAVHTLAVRGLDTECFGDPSANYVTPGGSNPHYRTLRPVVVPVPVVVNRKENTSAWLDNFNKQFPPINRTLNAVHVEQMQK